MRPRKINDKELLRMVKRKIPQKDIAAHFNCSEPAITKRLKYLGEKTPPSFQKLTEKEQSFCLEYAQGKSATEAAMKTYDVSSRDSAKSYGSTLLKKPSIKSAISDIVNFYSPKHARAEKLAQHIHEGSEPASLKGLELSFKLDKSFEDNQKVINSWNFVPREDFDKLVHSLGLYIDATKLLGELRRNYPPEYRTQKHEELLKALRETIDMLMKRYEEEYGKFENPEFVKMINDINKRM